MKIFNARAATMHGAGMGSLGLIIISIIISMYLGQWDVSLDPI